MSTLWDYINRAMPWNAPKSLSTVDEVYARDGLHPEHGRACCPTTSRCREANIAEVQKRAAQPQRHDHRPCACGLARTMSNGGRPDVARHGPACATAQPRPRWPPSLPDHARNAHGNLAEQNRLVGPQLRRRHHAPGRPAPLQAGRGATPVAPAARPQPPRPPRRTPAARPSGTRPECRGPGAL
jgi:cytochrome c